MTMNKQAKDEGSIRSPKRLALAVGTGSTVVREAIQALDLADAVLGAVVAYREYIPRDIAIHAETVRNICKSAAHELRQPPANAKAQTRAEDQP